MKLITTVKQIFSSMQLRCIVLYLCAALLLACFGTRSFAQKKLDSLRSVLRTAKLSDTDRIKVMANLSMQFRDDKADSIMLLGKQIIAMSEKAGYETGRGLGLQQQGMSWLYKNDYKQAIDNLKPAMQILEKNGYKKGLREVVHALGNIYYRMDDHKQAMEYYTRSRQISSEIGDTRGLALAFDCIGNINTDQGNHAEAVKNYLQALTLFEQTNSRQGMVTVMSDLGAVYSQMGDFKKALEYVNKTMELQKGMGNKQGLMGSLVTNGNIYGQMGDGAKSLEQFRQALLIADTLGDDYWRNICYVNMGEAYNGMGRLDEAVAMYAKALKGIEKIPDEKVIMSANNGIGRILVKQGKTQEGIKHLLVAYEVMKASGMKKVLFESAQELAKTYEQVHDYKNALVYHKEYLLYRDSIFNETTDKRIQELQFDYALKKKQQEIELLNKDKTIEKSKREEQKVLLLSLVAGLALLLIIIVLLYRSRAQEQHSKKKILKQKEEIQEQADKLVELNHFKDKTFSVLSHDLRGPINAFTSTIRALNEEAITSEEYNQMKPEVNRQLSSLNLLLDNVLIWAKSHMQEHIAARPQQANLYHVCRENVTLTEDAAARKNITITNRVPQSSYVFCDPGQLDIVIRNLITNAIKYTNEGGSIMLSAEYTGDKVQISVADTGVGMTPEQLQKLFTPTSINQTYGTAGEKGIGLGLVLCNEFIKANNGTITATSELGKGSTFIVELPRQ